ncbi:Arc family DNA-binding protein [Aurantiacibacter aquimixticola]|uniref:Arc family DNA-binding protein n=1 Tax=Aurantiacibacter aquimixticola TaxID=1958945 RepID=A0A419RUF3_9SPHN|nr:Arc family DNA-binding protein [Aurantiacibacter aquimixticola]RJY09421.1 Arc family DNA-binding protein [Aurantiacibacter aquimixticola]
MAAKPKPTKAFALRLDPALHDAVERLAAKELRSVNAEIEVLMREALKKRGIDVPVTPRAKRGRPTKGE